MVILCGGGKKEAVLPRKTLYGIVIASQFLPKVKPYLSA